MRSLRHRAGHHDVLDETRKLLADDGRSLEADLPASENGISSAMRCDATTVLDYALWHQQSVDDVNDAIGGPVILADKRNAIDEELSSLSSDTENFAVKWCKCSAGFKNSAELKARDDMMRNDALQKIIV